MLRSAAKNHERVGVVVDPDDYAGVLADLEATGGATTATRRLALARKVYAHTAAYDGAIAAYLSAVPDDALTRPAEAPPRAAYPGTLTVQWHKQYDLRYGENPHQSAAFYADGRSPLPRTPATRPSLATAEVLGGKQLSYNNLLDLDAALGLALEFAGDARPAAIVVKHNNPCGVALGDTLAKAYARARAADPVSAFGGIVAVTRPVDAELAAPLAEAFLEWVIAPGYTD